MRCGVRRAALNLIVILAPTALQERVDHNGNRSVYQFAFDKVFKPNASQVEVFQHVGKSAVARCDPPQLRGVGSRVHC